MLVNLTIAHMLQRLSIIFMIISKKLHVIRVLSDYVWTMNCLLNLSNVAIL